MRLPLACRRVTGHYPDALKFSATHLSLGKARPQPQAGRLRDSATLPDSGPWSEPPPDVALSSLVFALFFLLVPETLKLMSLDLHPLRFCRLAVFLNNPTFPPP